MDEKIHYVCRTLFYKTRNDYQIIYFNLLCHKNLSSLLQPDNLHFAMAHLPVRHHSLYLQTSRTCQLVPIANHSPCLKHVHCFSYEFI